MPVIGIPVDMLLERIETRLDRDDLVEHLQHLGCDVEGYATVRRFRCQRCDNMLEITETEHPPVLCDRCGADFREAPELQDELGTTDVIRMELLAVRPDMFDPGGLARVLRNYLGERAEPARYELAAPTFSVTVEPLLATDACYRPAIACAIVRGITLTDDRIKVIMKLQENLHWAMGRDRKHASIGVYDLDRISGPALRYQTVGPEELRFAPLGHDPQDAASALSPAQILADHPKGQAYARLLEGFERYPLLSDAAGQVLSLPPIINSEQTRVRRETRRFFIDVTGTGERIVGKALNVLVTSLAELDPEARIEQVEICYADRTAVTPDLVPQRVALDPAMVARVVGVELDREDVARHLQQMGHAVGDSGGGPLEVEVPAYRNDIMHPIDLVEDVAIAYGYHNIVPLMVPTLTVGGELEIERIKEVVRRSLLGLGYTEVLTLILSTPAVEQELLRLPPRDDTVLIENPISVEQTMIRSTLLAGLLDTFAVNASHELPQTIFEVGNISLLDDRSETGAREWPLAAAGVIGPRADYAQVRSTCEALLRELGWQLDAAPLELGCFIPGRGACVIAWRGAERLVVGVMGEVHPQVLEGYKLVHPVAVFEVDLSLLVDLGAAAEPSGAAGGPFVRLACGA